MTDTVPIIYAFTLGLIAAVNPCGFPLLPAYLAFFATDDARGPDGGRTRGGQELAGQAWLRRTARGLTAGACVTAGFLVVFGFAGVIVESGMRVIIGWIPWAMILIAAALIALGIRGLAGGHLRLRLPTLRFGAGSGVLTMTGFGIAYAVASLSCALPLFLAGVAGAFTRMGALAGGATFAAYALGMGVFVTAASLLAAHAGPGSIRRLGAFGRFIPRIAAAAITLVGLYLLYYWISDLVSPLSTSLPVRIVDAAQSAVSSALSAAPLVVGSLAGVLVISALAGAAWAIYRHSSPRKAQLTRDGVPDD